MRIIISEFMSLDGVVQAPGGPEEDTEGGFAHGGWSHPYFDAEAMGPVFGASMQTTEALLFGRRTWRVMADAWPQRAGDPFADHMNSVKKYVASRTLSQDDIDWENTELLGDDAIAAIAALREREGGELQVMGSASLARQLFEADLVDRVDVMLEPILLGGGKRIFPEDGVARPLELASLTQASTGVLICSYRPVR
jgi:dihydrofolate reductase